MSKADRERLRAPASGWPQEVGKEAGRNDRNTNLRGDRRPFGAFC